MRALMIAASLFALSATAYADPLTVSARRENTIGVDGAFVLPVGDYANVATVGVGALGRFEAPAGPGFVTGRLGVIAHAMRVNADLTLIPIFAGYRVPVADGGFYVAGELGLSIEIGTVETSFGRMSANDTKLGLTLGGGLKRGALDFRAGLFSPDVSQVIALMATVGYDFAAF
jgi:hypothetical protein